MFRYTVLVVAAILVVVIVIRTVMFLACVNSYFVKLGSGGLGIDLRTIRQRVMLIRFLIVLVWFWCLENKNVILVWVG